MGMGVNFFFFLSPNREALNGKPFCQRHLVSAWAEEGGAGEEGWRKIWRHKASDLDRKGKENRGMIFSLILRALGKI